MTSYGFECWGNRLLDWVCDPDCTAPRRYAFATMLTRSAISIPTELDLAACDIQEGVPILKEESIYGSAGREYSQEFVSPSILPGLDGITINTNSGTVHLEGIPWVWRFDEE